MKIRATDLPGVNAIYKDYIHNFQRVANYYSMDYAKEKSVLDQVERLRNRRYPRIEVGRALEKQNKAFGAGKATLKNLEDLALGNANVIITGQQVGLFGGPMYVLYKALTAIKLADRLSRVCKDCFVPVFWLATDDTDFHEVRAVTVLTKNYENIRLELDPGLSHNQPVSGVILPGQITALINELDALSLDTEFKTEILQALREAYQPGRSLGEAFGRWIMHLLQDFGLILIDPSDPEIKKLAADIFIKEIQENSPSTEAVLSSTRQLDADGYTPQLHLRPGFLNLFYFSQQRHALEYRNQKIRSTDGAISFEREQLVTLARQHPEQFAPNVVLRALMQDYIFPTVAYVAGPAEIAYFAQLKHVYEIYDLPMPLIYPRKSLTLIEPAIDRILDKYQLRVPNFWGNVEEEINKITRQHLPESLFQALNVYRQEWPQSVRKLKPEIQKVDPTLEKMTDSTAGRIAHALDQLEKKVLQAGKRQNEIVRKQFAKASASLYPEHTLQERRHNYTPYLVKYGPIFIERLYEVMDIAGFCHQLVRL